ncbi:MAG: hypothetical protein H0A76_09015 [Candidatus Thiodubiliella endoseptemdiera]|uniref:Bacterial Ig-like domain-containing protein n=1 Tax=Candidatus Thiodubiliella endoseptemdiera TaxID=2738886 RepID=A0A853F3P1_9GAMM|nr:hypothetical protein [Candidatus Thiodubiliella endoseptemdiera]
MRNGETATVTFDFSEELATDSFNLNDITTANGNLTNLSIDSTNLSRYTATYTATKDIDSIHISFSLPQAGQISPAIRPQHLSKYL